MRICFFGTPAPAVPSLRALAADERIEVARVVTNPDRPAGRGYGLTPPPVMVTAARRQPRRRPDRTVEPPATSVSPSSEVAA